MLTETNLSGVVRPWSVHPNSSSAAPVFKIPKLLSRLSLSLGVDCLSDHRLRARCDLEAGSRDLPRRRGLKIQFSSGVCYHIRRTERTLQPCLLFELLPHIPTYPSRFVGGQNSVSRKNAEYEIEEQEWNAPPPPRPLGLSLAAMQYTDTANH